MPYPNLIIFVKVKIILSIVHQELIFRRADTILRNLQGYLAEYPGTFIAESLVEGGKGYFTRPYTRVLQGPKDIIQGFNTDTLHFNLVPSILRQAVRIEEGKGILHQSALRIGSVITLEPGEGPVSYRWSRVKPEDIVSHDSPDGWLLCRYPFNGAYYLH